MADLPTGTVTFLFTDIEGSTSLWEHDPQGMRVSLEIHNDILHQNVSNHSGKIFKIVGDSFQAAFDQPYQALEAALEAQRDLSTADWGTTGPLQVRMGLHTGPAESQGGDYVVSHTLNRVARVMSVGYGGQILLTSVVAELVRDKMPGDTSLRDLGEHFLKGLTKSEHIFQLISPQLPAEFPALQTKELIPNNLPHQINSFIGRDREIVNIKTLLDETRLVTLIGSGGVGKSRLAVEVGHQVLNEYSHGVWLVELVSLSDPNLLPQAVATALGIWELKGHNLIDLLTGFLRDKRYLMILDNCEHMLDACANLARHLLTSCPSLTILASSREALGLEGERSYQVPSLSLPDEKSPSLKSLAQSEAITLFIDRSQTSLPGFRLTEDNAQALAKVCRRLDGIPLAIEMAAARMNLLRVEQVANRLDDRFHLLTAGSRSALPHQQTLRGTIDWSYDLLMDKERNLFQKLSIFAGGWDLEAAEFVCEGNGVKAYDVMDLIDSLVSKSLILAERQPGEETRFFMLETIHQYAREKFLESGNTEQVRQRHFEYYFSLMQQAHQTRYGDDKGFEVAKWLDQIEIEHDNLRAALNWIIVEKKAESASQLIIVLNWFWNMHDHHQEAREWSYKVLAICTPGSRAYATILRIIGNQHFALGNYDQGRACLEESINLFQEFGETKELAISVQSLGWIATALGEYDEARRLIERSLNLSQQLADKYEIAWAYLSLGELARAENKLDLAYQYHTQSLALFRDLDSKGPISIELSNLAFVILHQGNYKLAIELFVESLLISLKLGTKSHNAVVLGGLASVAQREGQAERAARLFGAAAAIHEDLGRAIDPGDVADFKEFQAATRADLSEQAFSAAWTEGQAMTLGQAIAYALEEK